MYSPYANNGRITQPNMAYKLGSNNKIYVRFTPQIKITYGRSTPLTER